MHVSFTFSEAGADLQSKTGVFEIRKHSLGSKLINMTFFSLKTEAVEE